MGDGQDLDNIFEADHGRADWDMVTAGFCPWSFNEVGVRSEIDSNVMSLRQWCSNILTPTLVDR